MSLVLSTVIGDPKAKPHADPSIDINCFTDNKATGGEGGTPFRFIQLDKGAFLTRIKVWKKQWLIIALEVEMSDGSKATFGKPSGNPSEFHFRQGEQITKLKFEGVTVVYNEMFKLKSPVNSTRRGLRAIKIETNQKRSWGVNIAALHDEKRYRQAVGSGICCGVFGASSDIIDRLGFAMLRPIKKAVLCNIEYESLDSKIVASEPDIVATQVFKNESDIEQAFTLKGSRNVTTKEEWGLSGTLSMNVITEAMVGVPKVSYAKAGCQWSVSATASHKVEKSITETKEWDWPLKCPPKRQIFASATMYVDQIDIDYIADVELEFDNGKRYTFKQKGVYNGLSARSGTIEIEDVGPYSGSEQSRP